MRDAETRLDESREAGRKSDRSLGDFLDPAAIDALRRPIKEASGLPRVVYSDAEFFRFETEQLLPRQWMSVAYAAAIPDAGDALPATVAGLPLVLVRGDDGEIRAFHNVCRHRGTIVVTKPLERARTLRCSYHSWTWNLDGELRSRPLWDGREDRAEDCLVRVRSKIWCGIVFVTLSNETPPFDENFRFLRDRWKVFDFDALTPFAIRDWTIKTNWKLHALGVLEPYHEPFIHPQIVNMVTDEATGEKRMDNDTFDEHLFGNCMGISTPMDDRDYSLGDELPLLPGPPDTFARSADIFSLFPNTSVVIFPNHILTMICTPLAVDRSRIEIALFVEAEAASAAERETDRDSLLADWTLITEQDAAALELQQAGHVSPVADGAKFSPFWEGTAHYFEKHVVDVLETLSATPSH